MLVGIYEFVRRTLYRLLLGRAEELDDLQQASLLRVLTSLPRYRHEAAFKTWVTAICINVVRDHLRRRRREPQLDRGIDRDELGSTGAELGSQRRFEAREALNHCARILETMPVHQRTAFVLKAVHGHSIEEIAQMMNSAHSTTRLRLYYARRVLRKALTASAPVSVRLLSTQEGNDGAV